MALNIKSQTTPSLLLSFDSPPCLSNQRGESQFHFAPRFGKNNQILMKCWQLFDKILISDDICWAPGQRPAQFLLDFPSSRDQANHQKIQPPSTFSKTIKIFWRWLGRILVNVSIDVKIGPKTLSHHPHLHHHSISEGTSVSAKNFWLSCSALKSPDKGRYSRSYKMFELLSPEKARSCDLIVVDDLIRRGSAQKLPH